VFVIFIHFTLCLIFLGKAGAYNSGTPLQDSALVL